MNGKIIITPKDFKEMKKKHPRKALHFVELVDTSVEYNENITGETYKELKQQANNIGNCLELPYLFLQVSNEIEKIEVKKTLMTTVYVTPQLRDVIENNQKDLLKQERVNTFVNNVIELAQQDINKGAKKIRLEPMPIPKKEKDRLKPYADKLGITVTKLINQYGHKLIESEVVK